MEEGFLRGQSDNLPKVDFLMVAEYFTTNSKYLSSEIRGQKLATSGRDSYGDNAIGYVQVKREGPKCTVKARITPEHKVRATAYHVSFACDENEKKIESVECVDCAASRGGCKHTMALVMWLHRRSEEPACTEISCYWNKPKLSQVGSQLKFIRAKEMGHARKPTSSSTATTISDGSFLQSVVKKSKEERTDSQIMSYFLPTEPLYKASIHYLIHEYKKANDNMDAERFMQFCKENITAQQCIAIEKATVSQADCKLWYELRYARITASKAHEAAHCETTDGVLVEYFLGAYKFKETFSIKRGKRLENAVLEEVSKIKKAKIKKAGLILCKDFPILGASPDGITDDFILEIKCPISNTNIKNYVNQGKVTPKYYAQMQMQMLFANKDKCIFCIAHEDFETTKKVDTYEVIYDKEYCEELLKKCIIFWAQNIFNKLFE